MDIKKWADKTFTENLKTINEHIREGIDKKAAYHIVMDGSTLGAGYKAQMKQELNLSMFD